MFERLTADKVYLNSIRFGIQVNFPPHCGHEKAKEVDDFVKNVFDRLAAYEDSGLTSEQVQELAKAKADGRMVVLPCKVGTRVWVIEQNCDMCRDMYAEEPCLFGDCEYKEVFESIFSIGMTDKFGKTVFLTREEAEAALRKEQSDETEM